MEMKQVDLINCVLETIKLDNGMSKKKFTPSESSPVVKDAYGPEACGSFSYISVIRMLPQLSGHTCLDISYEVNCCDG